MYKCWECESVFSEPVIVNLILATRFEPEDYDWECPECGSLSVEETVFCRGCGGDEFIDDLDEYMMCENCLDASISEGE